jgi:hypothetical protein
MRFTSYLKETYVMRFHASGGNCEVFSDPSYKELMTESDHVRFFYINNTFYTWDANKSTHYEVCGELGVNYSDLIFGGIGKKFQGRILYTTDDWAGELFFPKKHRDKVFAALKKCKHWFYNYDDIVDHFKMVIGEIE